MKLTAPLLLALPLSALTVFAAAAADNPSVPEELQARPGANKATQAETEEPAHIMAGRFRIIPSIDVEEEYNDNIYATTHHRKAAFITRVRPGIEMDGTCDKLTVDAQADATINKYARFTNENYDDYYAHLGGKYQALRDTALTGSGSWAREHEERGDPNDIGQGVEPTQYDIATGRVGIVQDVRKLQLKLESEVRNYDFKQGFTAAGALVDNDLRDRTQYTQSLRAGYALQHGMEVYAKGSIDSRQYDRTAPLNRNSRGQTAVAGFYRNIENVFRADVFAGVGNRNYGFGLKDVTTPLYGADLKWNARPGTSVDGWISRSIDETTIAGSSSYIYSAYGIGVDHDLAPKWTGRAEIEYDNSDYQGNAGSQRNDDIYTGMVRARYALNRVVSIGPEYRYLYRNSNVAGGDYSDNSLLLRLSAAY
jgi:hypothetical protein